MAFVSLETDYENRQYEKKMAAAHSVNQTINYVSQLLWFYQAEENMTFTNYTSLVCILLPIGIVRSEVLYLKVLPYLGNNTSSQLGESNNPRGWQQQLRRYHRRLG